jgi:hypothetical protein
MLMVSPPPPPVVLSTKNLLNELINRKKVWSHCECERAETTEGIDNTRAVMGSATSDISAPDTQFQVFKSSRGAVPPPGGGGSLQSFTGRQPHSRRLAAALSECGADWVCSKVRLHHRQFLWCPLGTCLQQEARKQERRRYNTNNKKFLQIPERQKSPRLQKCRCKSPNQLVKFWFDTKTLSRLHSASAT